MVTAKPIRSEDDYEDALARLGEIFQADDGTPDGDERDILSDLIEVYEERHYPIGLPSPVRPVPRRQRPHLVHRRPDTQGQ